MDENAPNGMENSPKGGKRAPKVAARLFGTTWKSALFTPSHSKNCLLSRLLPGWAACAVRVTGWLSLPLYPIFCLFFLDYMNFGKLAKMEVFWAEHPLSALYETLVILVLFAGLLLLLRRGALAAGTMGIVSVIFGYINFMKLKLNGDPFQPHDFSMAGQVRELSEFISGDLPRWFYLGLAVMVLWVLFLALSGTNLPLRWTVRFPFLMAGALVIFSAYSTPEKANARLTRYNMNFFDAALQTSNYNANGFVGAFTVNLLMNRTEPPEGYSEARVRELLEGYNAVEQTEEDYDVIVVLSESFFDVRTLPGVEFSENPLKNYDEIIKRPGAYSGYIFTTATSGGTVRPEFEILTGLSTDYLHDVASPYEFVTAPVEGYVSNYKNAGYRTVALHPYIGSFYRRDKAYPLLGFDEFLDIDGVSAIVEPEYKRGLVSDRTTFEAIKYELENAGGPIFLEAITMQNHQPFDKLPEEDIEIAVSSEALSGADLDAVTTYTQGLADADRMLRDLVDYIDTLERPTVLLFYGDHLPNLGDAYTKTGAITGANALEDLEYKYSTPFVIYTNTAAGSDMLPSKTGNRVSDYYLLEIIARMTGFHETPYMSLLNELHGKVPFYNVRLWPMEVTEDVARLCEIHKLITYDRLLGKRWSTGS